jgi:hypothetical protein
MKRITNSELQAIVDRINKITNSPRGSYVKDDSGKFKAQIDNYHLSFAYGGVSLHRMTNESGGVIDVLSCGHVSKRELQRMMFSYISGLNDADIL